MRVWEYYLWAARVKIISGDRPRGNGKFSELIVAINQTTRGGHIMKMIKRFGMLVAAAMLTTFLGISTALAVCKGASKYLAVYAQYPENVGTSWRYYIRPRNGSCLKEQSSSYPGMPEPVQLKIHDGLHNCKDNYKSYVTIAVTQKKTYDLNVRIGTTKPATGSGAGGYNTTVSFVWDGTSTRVTSACVGDHFNRP